MSKPMEKQKAELEDAAKPRDILETSIYSSDPETLHLLLADHSTGRNIRWATKDYRNRGTKGFREWDQITIPCIIRKNGFVIQPRIDKPLSEQRARSTGRGEVFTPSWICNKQNNLVDAAWFARKNAGFNEEDDANGHTWRTIRKPVTFPRSRSWEEYVKAPRLEVTCGEAPYLTSRYDSVTGKFIPPPDRIGLLDRKLRIVSEHQTNREGWLEWALIALKATYGYEYQGDNVLIARENVLFAVKEYYRHIFGEAPTTEFLRACARVISWNIWQMDGIKFVVPGTCHNVRMTQMDLFSPDYEERGCPGCLHDDVNRHNGVRCRIMAWDSNTPVYFKPPFDFEPIPKEDSHDE